MSATTLLAYHNDPAIKAKYLARVRAHREADALIQGTGWDRGKGCAVGCTLEAYEHERYPIELGIPEQLAHLEDNIFEELKNGEALAWPEQFLGAIQPGADLSMVWPRFAVWLLADLEKIEDLADDVRACIVGVRACYERRIAGDEPSDGDWQKAGVAAWDAWEARAAWAAWDARGARAAKRTATFWPDCRDELLRLLREAPVGGAA